MKIAVAIYVCLVAAGGAVDGATRGHPVLGGIIGFVLALGSIYIIKHGLLDNG